MTTVRIKGQDYPVAFSLRAWQDINEEFGSIEGFGKALSDQSTLLPALNDGLKILMKAGRLLAPEECPPPLKNDPIDLLMPSDIQPVINALNQCMRLDAERHVETVPPKNADAMQD